MTPKEAREEIKESRYQAEATTANLHYKIENLRLFLAHYGVAPPPADGPLHEQVKVLSEMVVELQRVRPSHMVDITDEQLSKIRAKVEQHGTSSLTGAESTLR